MSRVTVFLIALALGALGGWKSVDHGTAAGANPEPRRPATESSGPKWKREDFLERIREAKDQQGHNPLAGELASWTDAEIHAALEQSLTDPDCVLGSGVACTGYLLGEWMKRDFEAAFAWHEGLGSHPARKRLASMLSYQWPPKKAERGLEFARENRSLFSGLGAWSILTKTMESRAHQGPAAVEELLRLVREEKMPPVFDEKASFPPGFDFATLMNGEEVGKLLDDDKGLNFMRAWFSQNRDQAFDWMLANRGAKSVLEGAFNPRGDDRADKMWIGAKIESLPVPQRDEVIEEIRNDWFSSPRLIEGLLAGIKDPEITDELRQIGVQSIFAGQLRAALPMIEASGDPARRIELLEQTAPPDDPRRRRWIQPLNANDEAFLRNKLSEWNATGEQADAIISRFKS